MNAALLQLEANASEIVTRIIEEADALDLDGIVSAAFEDLGEAERDAFAVVGLRYMLRRRFAVMRHVRGGSHSPGWASVTKAQANGSLEAARLSVLDIPYSVDGRWLTLGDCTLQDLEWLADDYAARADANQTEADRMRELGKRLKRKKVEQVSELDEGVVASVMGAA